LPKVKITVKNYGRTPAFVWEESADIALRLPEPLVYPNAVSKEAGCVIEAKDSYQLTAKSYDVISDEAISEILERKKLLWVYGYISYRDFLGKQGGKMPFCAEFYIPQAIAKNNPTKWIQDCPNKYAECHEGMEEP
jgi:hypothetical protein